MRIISKFKDYYDSVQIYGYDNYPIYLRNTKEEQVNFSPYGDVKDNNKKEALSQLYAILKSMPRDQNCNNGVIAFCGKAYPFWRNIYVDNISKNTIYTFEQYLNFVEQAKKDISYRRWDKAISKKKWDNFFNEANFKLNDYPFRYFKSPILLLYNLSTIRDNNLIINPELKSYDFASIVDPYNAYQELSMFIGNNLVDQKDPSPKISDKLKAETHGFNKWSFRKLSTAKKKRKK